MSEILKKIIAIGIFFWLIFVLFNKENEWTGFYYRDKNNIGDSKTWVIQPGLNSREDCIDWVIKTSRGNENYDYECGYKCRYDKVYEASICEKTIK